MIKFDNNEFEYIKNQFDKIVKDYTKENLEDESYKDFVRSIGEDSVQTAKEFLNDAEKHSLENINSDEDLNKKISNAIYWIEGMWCFIDACMDTEELRELLGNGENEEYFTIYNKILYEDDTEE